MKTQHQINKAQGETNDEQTVLNEKTRFDLRFNNAWAIAISLIISAFAFGVTYTTMSTKLDMVIEQQKELTMEFRQWRSQAETRLGMVESRQNIIITYAEKNWGISIK